jgi:hypothetical protein
VSTSPRPWSRRARQALSARRTRPTGNEHLGVRAQVLAPSRQVHKTGPSTIEPEVHWKFRESASIPCAEKYLVALEGATIELPGPATHRAAVWGAFQDCPRVVLPDGSVAVESTQALVKPCLPHAASSARPMEGDYFSLLSPYASDGNYYHWTHDVLLSLFAVAEHLPPGTRFIVQPELRDYHRDSLGMLGIGEDRLVTFDVAREQEAPRSWLLERLWFSPGPIGPTASPDALAWLREQAVASLDTRPRRAHRLLYVSRGRARHRRVVNEDEVSAYLADRGFEVHVLEDYTLHEQIALFAEAKAVVGPHGAGHANMVFSPPGLVLVDLLGSEVNKCFHNMSLAIGHDYWYTFGDDVPSGSVYTDDISVPLDKLERITSLALPDGDGRA